MPRQASTKSRKMVRNTIMNEHEDLPDDVILYIAPFLNPIEVNTMQAVSHSWRDAFDRLEDYWETRYILSYHPSLLRRMNRNNKDGPLTSRGETFWRRTCMKRQALDELQQRLQLEPLKQSFV